MQVALHCEVAIDYQSDKSVDYLSPGEDELIELRNRMKANRKPKAKAKDKLDEEMNEPNEENSMPADNVRAETFKEHDIYMNELLKSLKTTDKDGITKDPFVFVEKHVEMYPLYDETTHWRLRKPKLRKEEKGNHVQILFKKMKKIFRRASKASYHETLLTMLEAIRVIVLERMNKIREISRNQNLVFWHVILVGGNLYEVRSGSEGFTIDEGKRTCSCRMWELSGLPCVYSTKIQVEDQVEQTEDQSETDLTQLQKTQEPTQDQVQELTQQP
nr:pentatricopeptide repeat-containing protein [Tanacetum cinerariifolium]